MPHTALLVCPVPTMTNDSPLLDKLALPCVCAFNLLLVLLALGKELVGRKDTPDAKEKSSPPDPQEKDRT